MSSQDERVYKLALKRAARIILIAPPESLEKEIFPVWQKAIHQMLLRRGHLCRRSDKDGCFLNFDPEEQKTLFRDSGLSFENFVSIILEAHRLFLAESGSLEAVN